MKKQNFFFLNFLVPFLVLVPSILFVYEWTSQQGMNVALAGPDMKENDTYSLFQENDDSSFPTNPMELMNVLKSIESIMDRTPPSDAIDDALKAFESENQKEFSLDSEIK